MKFLTIILFLVFNIYTFFSPISLAEPYNGNNGKVEAQKYFIEDQQRRNLTSANNEATHYMSLHIGGFTESVSHDWGEESKDENIGVTNIGVTYLMGEWSGSMDLFFRFDFISYEIDDQKPLKMSLMPIITFPEVASKFPLYFGFGLGMGVFFKQVNKESTLSLDYQLLAGLRFLNFKESLGFFCEGGLKNHLHLLTDGQFNGVFFSTGVVFLF